MRRLLSTPQSALDEINTQYGPVCGLGAGPLRMTVIGEPAAIRSVLMQPNERFRYDVPISPFPFVVGKHTMLNADGAEHRRRRGAVVHAFSRRRLNRWIPMIVTRTDLAIDGVLTGDELAQPVDLYPVGRRLLIEIVVRALFGERLVDHTADIDVSFQRTQQYLSSPLYRQLPHPIPGTLRSRVRSDRQRLDALIDTAIAQSRADAGEPIDVLDELVSSGELSDAEIRDQVKTLIGAGYDTTASSLAWMVWEATTNGDLWERLGHEADEVLGAVDSGQAVDERSLARLTLANHVMRETLRLHPASGVAARTTACDVTVGDFAVDRGTMLLWSPYLAGRDPAFWDRPDQFDPSRFDELDETQRRLSDEAWMPFGAGPRMCIGFALAQIELTLIVARLAQRLRLEPTAVAPPEPVGLVVSQPKGGAAMYVARRG